MEALVEVKNLAKRFGRRWALEEVNLTVPRGVICGVLGVNGAGKSTLLRILAGVQRPTFGEVRILGQRPGRLTKARVAFVPEIDHLYPWMNVQEAMDFTASFYQDFNRERAAELQSLMQLEPSACISTLSRGFRARLKLLLAMSRDAALILLDEPLSGIDPISRRKIGDAIIQAYRPAHSTILIATHLIDEIEPVLDRVVFLHRGRVVLDEEAEVVRAARGRSVEDFFREVLA